MTNKAKAFEWNKENEATITAAYQLLIEESGLAEANTNDSLGKIAKQVGAKSAQAVRSKLSALKVYEKADKPRSVRGTVKTQKVHFIRALQKVAQENGVELTGRKFESLEQGVGTDLQLVVDLLEAVTGEKILVNPDQQEAPAPKQETAKA